MTSSQNNLETLTIPELSNLYNKYYTQLKLEAKQYPSISELIFKIDIVISTLIKTFSKISLTTYEQIIRANENRIRHLIKKQFELGIQREALEYKVNYLIIKEKECEKIKEVTGAVVENGKVLCANRKDNEILILRAENSNLKAQIEKNEDEIKLREQKEFEIKQEYLKERKKLKSEIDLLNKQLNLTQRSIHSHSNINININDISNGNLVINNTAKTKRNNQCTIDNTEDQNTTECYSLKCNCSTSNNKNKKIHLSNSTKKMLFISPFKSITSSFSPINHQHNNSYTKRNKKRKSSNKKTYINKSNSNIKKKKFIHTQSSINNFLLYRSNNNSKNIAVTNSLSTREKCSINYAFSNGKIKITTNNIK